MRNFLKSLPQALLILLFVYAAASKLINFGDFKGQLYNQAFPHWLADVLAYVLPSTELLAAVLMIYPRSEMTGLVLSLDLLLLFSGYIALVLLHFWDRVPCSCGGILSHMGWGTHLVFNLFFAALNIIAIRVHLRNRRNSG